MCARRLLATAVSLVRLVPGSRAAPTQVPRLLQPAAPRSSQPPRLLQSAAPHSSQPPRLLQSAAPHSSPLLAPPHRYGAAAGLATSAAFGRAAADGREPPAPPRPSPAVKKPIELDVSPLLSKRRVQKRRSVVTDGQAATGSQPDQHSKKQQRGRETLMSHVFSSELELPSYISSYKRVSPPNARKRHKDMEVVAYSTAEEYSLERLVHGLQEQNLYHPSAMSEDVHDVLHVSARYTLGAEPREIYLFREGTVVFWNVPEPERRGVLDFLPQYEARSYDPATVENESESMPYSYTEVFNKTRLVNGRILLNVEGTTDLEKYAFSNAMALSVKLGIWESALENYIDSIEHVTEELRKGGSVSMKKQEVLKKNGELFGLRHLINLSSDCLDTPDFYWDKENLESIYQKTCNHLNIAKRTRVMNEKLNHCVELADMLTSNLQDKHHVRLEWMIIVLIMVEVGFEVIHFIERYT